MFMGPVGAGMVGVNYDIRDTIEISIAPLPAGKCRQLGHRSAAHLSMGLIRESTARHSGHEQTRTSLITTLRCAVIYYGSVLKLQG